MLKRLQNRGIMILVFLAVFVQAGTVGAKVLEIEVRDAILLAEEHNLDFRLVKIDWQAAQSDLERALIVGEPEMLAEAKKNVGTGGTTLFGAQKQPAQFGPHRLPASAGKGNGSGQCLYGQRTGRTPAGRG